MTSQSVSARFGAAGIEIIIRRIDAAADPVPTGVELAATRHAEGPSIPPVLPSDWNGLRVGSVV